MQRFIPGVTNKMRVWSFTREQRSFSGKRPLLIKTYRWSVVVWSSIMRLLHSLNPSLSPGRLTVTPRLAAVTDGHQRKPIPVSSEREGGVTTRASVFCPTIGPH
ncbi:unnamed protein product [Pleuronectes platessa]|uniref:Uncharacterized protein n=1 Tax=Pleuronectes platessa TaxID=8262 RepID=A0A9N7V911_PLEPL|nr:unnamed protein product [Pleuronectes platessa]